MTEPRMDLRRIARAGVGRRRALRQADLHLDVVVDEVVKAGGNRNVELAARLAEVSKVTLYRRLRERQQQDTPTP